MEDFDTQKMEPAVSEGTVISATLHNNNPNSDCEKNPRQTVEELTTSGFDTEEVVIENNANGEVTISEDDPDFLCVICTELLINPVTLQCSHTFCEHCIKQWRDTSPLCPICRSIITSWSPSEVLNILIDKIVQNWSAELRECRQHLLNKRKVTMPPIKPPRRCCEDCTAVLWLPYGED